MTRHLPDQPDGEPYEDPLVNGLRAIWRHRVRLIVPVVKWAVIGVAVALVLFVLSIIAVLGWRGHQHRQAWPLMEAAADGDTAQVRKLLDEGADPDADTLKGRLPLSEAARGGHAEVVRLLLEHGAEPHPVAMRGAAQMHNHEIMRLLIDAGYDVAAEGERVGTAALHHVGDDPVAARILLDAGADPNAQNGSDQNPLYAAVESTEVTRLLLDAGADPNVIDSYLKITPLRWAAERGRVETARVLLEHGARVDLRIATRATSLQAAVDAGNQEMVRLLLEHGADPLATWHGRNAPDIAREAGHGDIAKLIEQHVAEEAVDDEAGRAE